MTDTNISMDRWGKDHWSAFAYIETCVVDHGGEPDHRRMRTDLSLHPNMGSSEPAGAASPVDGARYPTRLCGGAVASPHDDWSCLDDAEVAGLIANIGSGMYRRYRLTELGLEVAAALRAHKALGRSFATFRQKL